MSIAKTYDSTDCFRTVQICDCLVIVKNHRKHHAFDIKILKRLFRVLFFRICMGPSKMAPILSLIFLFLDSQSHVWHTFVETTFRCHTFICNNFHKISGSCEAFQIKNANKILKKYQSEKIPYILYPLTIRHFFRFVSFLYCFQPKQD